MHQTQRQRNLRNIRQRTMHPSRKNKQGGFSLVEMTIVIAVILVAVIVAVPAIKGIWIELRVPSAASELQRFMSRTRVMAEGDSITPYASIDNTKNLAPALRDSSVFKVSGNTVAHRLGGTGTGTNGTITLAPASLGGAGMGSAFSVTLTNVNAKACPVLASTLNAVSETISVNGTAAKTLGANNEVGSYNPVTAQNLCSDGDSNTFTFATR